MSHHETTFKGDVIAAITSAIESKIPNSKVEVNGAGGHYTIAVTSVAFSGLGRVDAQRLVYSAIAHLMAGDAAPVHAVDSLRTIVPS
ncbi:BolA/IbaG family iron-sulfur metabolism protein [Pendulispora albinea]|uniref:BolA/IbaG family iron-sulfur metabolism protein n=1 Tax=Pendulispora albinea TaxID=2741071 RepID=A0ABZ2LX10_9BACT